MAQTPEHSAPSEDEANAALNTILGRNTEPEGSTEGDKAPSERPPQSLNYASEENAPVEEAPEETAAEQQAEGDDVASLKARLEEAEKKQAEYDRRFQDIQTRSRQSIEATRARMLAKSTQLDKARILLERALTSEQGVDKAEVERLMAEIQSGYNPASSNYQPAPTPFQPQPLPSEDAISGVNDFLNENGILTAEADEFGAWARGPSHTLTQRDIDLANRDTYAFMHSAWPKFAKWKAQQEADKQPEPSVTAKAIKTVQKVQKAAARAASNMPSEAGGSQGQPKARKPSEVSDNELANAFRSSGGFRY